MIAKKAGLVIFSFIKFVLAFNIAKTTFVKSGFFNFYKSTFLYKRFKNKLTAYNIYNNENKIKTTFYR